MSGRSWQCLFAFMMRNDVLSGESVISINFLFIDAMMRFYMRTRRKPTWEEKHV
jgi:hypothetical protein